MKDRLVKAKVGGMSLVGVGKQPLKIKHIEDLHLAKI